MLHQIVKNNYNLKSRDSTRNDLGLLSDKEELLYVKTNIDGSKEYIFSTDTIRVFDEMVFNNDKKLFSPEQFKLMTSYLQEETSEVNSALDEYLGGFTEITNEPDMKCREGELYELCSKCK